MALRQTRTPEDLATALALPATRVAALSLLQDDNVRFGDLGDLVTADPGLTIILLRAANSAQSASLRRITHPRDAIIRVGLGQTKRLVAAAVVGRSFGNLAKCGINIEAFWSYSLASAIAAEEAADSRGARTAAFAAGLLHDLGRLALAASKPHVYPAITKRHLSERVVLAAEQLMFGENHAITSARLLLYWGMPGELIDMVAKHHNVPEGSGSALTRARRIVTNVGYTDGVQEDLDAGMQTKVAPEVASALHQRVEWYQAALYGSESAGVRARAH